MICGWTAGKILAGTMAVDSSKCGCRLIEYDCRLIEYDCRLLEYSVGSSNMA